MEATVWVGKVEAARRLGIAERTLERHIASGKYAARIASDGRREVQLSAMPEVIAAQAALEERSEWKALAERVTIERDREVHLARRGQAWAWAAAGAVAMVGAWGFMALSGDVEKARVAEGRASGMAIEASSRYARAERDLVAASVQIDEYKRGADALRIRAERAEAEAALLLFVTGE